MQFKAIQESLAKNSLAEVQTKRDNTIRLIKEENIITSQIKSKIALLEKENQALYSMYSKEENGGKIKKLNSLLNRAKFFAGMTNVQGEGIVISMDDSSVPAKDRLDSNPNWFVVHDKDIIRVINELRKNGAEAISINGERLVSTSAQVCMGPTIMINNKRYITPFEIKAIGNSRQMYEGIINSDIYKELVRFSLPISVNVSNDVLINKYELNTLIGG